LSYNIYDPVDVVRYLIDSKWNTGNYSPKPVIKAVFVLPNVRPNQKRKNYVRPYRINKLEEPQGLEKLFHNSDHIISIDIRSFVQDDHIEIVKEVKRIVEDNLANPNPAGETLYGELKKIRLTTFYDAGSSNFMSVMDVNLKEDYTYQEQYF
jgi:hypothetical protein